MLSKVKVYGHLAEHLGQSTFEAIVRVPADAIKFLLCNFPELRSLMRDGYYKVTVGAYDLQLADQPEQLHYPLAASDVVKVIPVVTGAEGDDFRGFGYILAGAALIGAAFTGGATLGLAGFSAAGTGAAATLAAAAGNIGLALVLGGTADLLSPTPETPSLDGDPRSDPNNFAFSGVQNTAREGVPVPIAYGEVIVGSVVISAGLNVEEI